MWDVGEDGDMEADPECDALFDELTALEALSLTQRLGSTGTPRLGM